MVHGNMEEYMEDDEVKMNVKEWAYQEKRLIEDFLVDIEVEYGVDAEFPPGQLDDMFRLWHEACSEPKPEDT